MAPLRNINTRLNILIICLFIVYTTAGKQGILGFPFKAGVHFLTMTTNVAAEVACSLYEFSYSNIMYYAQDNKNSPLPLFIRQKGDKGKSPCSSTALLKLDVFVKKHVRLYCIGSFVAVISCDPSSFDRILIEGNVNIWREYILVTLSHKSEANEIINHARSSSLYRHHVIFWDIAQQKGMYFWHLSDRD